MASRFAIKRLTSEYKDLVKSPTPYIIARPSEDDILLWYFLLTGPPDTDYEGGQYIGQLRFPANYPFGPPNIRMKTPSGRFEVEHSLCLSMSDFHKESWNPAWNVSTILAGLLSFMCSEESSTGAIRASPEVRQRLASKSVKWNMNNVVFQTEFSDIMDQIKSQVPQAEVLSEIKVIPPKPEELKTGVLPKYIIPKSSLIVTPPSDNSTNSYVHPSIRQNLVPICVVFSTISLAFYCYTIFNK
ncbi:E2 ubiquitin-conjugating protein [Starmerella bacillaris]|uniref:E2 ubiquitin-conjugating protein n=1 Tax=Starmerella bacillaris TaxID=1247836 RepID=A0AAV5RJ89_STABA|nr:E2 ubiquitin-conjugating protein [Starmerella bacillaris]